MDGPLYIGTNYKTKNTVDCYYQGYGVNWTYDHNRSAYYGLWVYYDIICQSQLYCFS